MLKKKNNEKKTEERTQVEIKEEILKEVWNLAYGRSHTVNILTNLVVEHDALSPSGEQPQQSQDEASNVQENV